MSNLSLSDLQERIRRLETQLEEMESNASPRMRIIPGLMIIVGVSFIAQTALPIVALDSVTVRSLMSGVGGFLLVVGLRKFCQ